MGGVGNGAAEEDSHRDLNSGMAAMQIGTTQFWQGVEPHIFWGELHSFGAPFTMKLRKLESKM